MVRWERSTSRTQVSGETATTAARLDSVHVAALVSQAKRGDGEAFATLYRHYLPEVYGFVAARLADREAAEDATQSIFFRALQSLETCRDEAAFPGWLFAIARNMVTDRYRATRFRPEALEMTFDAEDPTPLPEEVAIQRDDARSLREAREHCLSDSERDLFDLLLTDLNDKQIAAALGRSHGAVRTAHWRLLIKLRACLQNLAAQGGRIRASV